MAYSVQTVYLSFRPYDEGLDGYPLELHLTDTDESATDTVPRSFVVDSRPVDDQDAVLDEDGIHAILVRPPPLPSAGELERIGGTLVS